MFLRSKRGVHLRVVFFVGDSIGLPRDLLFQHSGDVLGERRFLADYNDEYSHRLDEAGWEAFTNDPAGLLAAEEAAVLAAAAADRQAVGGAAAGVVESTQVTSQTVDLTTGVVLLQDLKQQPDPVEVFEHPQDRGKIVVKWTPVVKLSFLLQYYPRGWGLRSPTFKIGRDGPFHLEFWPNGSYGTTKSGLCSICLHTPRMKNALCMVQFWTPDLDCFASQSDQEEQQNLTMNGGVSNAKRILTKEREYRLDNVVAPSGGILPSGAASSAAHQGAQHSYRPQERVGGSPTSGEATNLGGGTYGSENVCMLHEFCQAQDTTLEADTHGNRTVVLGCIFRRIFNEDRKDRLKSLAVGLDVGKIAFNNF
ncbi:unnamed protein product [Amoebophrya sp. A25]|nr:unnamed protein product [Amoebophrya sp. A25]|eukprot:GSA25T00001111001.1